MNTESIYVAVPYEIHELATLGEMMMAQKIRKDVVWWLGSAKDDYKSALRLYEVGMHANALNLLHTSIEKALKAAILWSGKRYPRGAEGHKLNLLYGMVKPKLRLPKRLEEAIFDLTPLYLPTKYPDAAFGIPSKVYGREYSSKYVRKAGEIIRWVERKMSRR